MEKKDIYFKEVLGVMPRILNLLNRNPSTKTYGSFDRSYWNYSTFDMSCARKQEAALTLALMYKINRKDNPYYNSEVLLNWIKSSLEFWTQIQNPDGSFNEVYPNEHAFNTTAFTCYTASEVLIHLGDKIDNRKKIIASLKRGGEWLLNKKESRVFNQQAGAAIALYNIYLVTKDERYKLSASRKIDFIIKNQIDEGWFYEYNGADIGYLSLCMDYLSKYYQKTQDKRLLECLTKAVEFISLFVHPNYTFGGEYGSRNTEYMIPHGFEILSNDIPMAKTISNAVREAIKRKTSVTPSTVDDKYLLFNSYTYLQAFLDSNDEKSKVELPYKKEFTKVLNKSGFLIHSSGNFYLVCNGKKGGALKITFKKNGKSLDDAGITLEYKDGKKFTSSWPANNKFSLMEDKFLVEGKTWRCFDNTLTPMKSVLLRVFQMTFGRIGYLSLKVKEFLRDKVISKTKPGDVSFRRTLNIGENSVGILDEITYLRSIKKLILSSKLSFIYGASSRYFQISDLDSEPFIFLEKDFKVKGGSG